MICSGGGKTCIIMFYKRYEKGDSDIIISLKRVLLSIIKKKLGIK